MVVCRRGVVVCLSVAGSCPPACRAWNENEGMKRAEGIERRRMGGASVTSVDEAKTWRSRMGGTSQGQGEQERDDEWERYVKFGCQRTRHEMRKGDIRRRVEESIDH